MTYETKHCPGCNTTYPKSEFTKNKARKDGVASTCKTCCLEYQRKHRHTLISKAAAYDKAMAILAAKKRAEAGHE